ncbi:MAG TPA: glycolate oxidase subunit GlcF [Steroidobacteraceae bacterium]|nr:glycolate oxidase subunit GlcF [Steroidobacteraceae bacterium]
MQTNLSSLSRLMPRASEAESILRSCVHCGFCNATCPTYQLTGDELDGPRGRIYLIKQMLEGAEAGTATQAHLDRCLTCRNCETTCPSGVRYHSLLDIGREELAKRVARTWRERLLRGALRTLVTRPVLFAFLIRIGQIIRPALPSFIRDKVPARAVPPGKRPLGTHTRTVLLLEGCVQPSLSPNTNAATARVLDRLGIQVLRTGANVRCCGAVDYHLDAQEQGLQHARRNIDAWWPAIQSGCEAIVQTASGCGAFVKEYGHLLQADSAYAAKARKVSQLSLDLVELVRREPLERLRLADAGEGSLAFHCPCTLQHAQKLGGAVEEVLRRLGFQLTAVPEAHLCCGSAGTYSLTQPVMSKQLRDGKLAALQSGDPRQIVTANIGCQVHLGAAAKVPVRHWIEIVDQAMQA